METKILPIDSVKQYPLIPYVSLIVNINIPAICGINFESIVLSSHFVTVTEFL
jgi:hypothetical protein